jgi:hypothetical protein
MKMKRPNPELIDDENPEWTEEDFAKAVPFSGLPAELKTCSPHPSASGKRRIPNLSANPRPDLYARNKIIWADSRGSAQAIAPG